MTTTEMIETARMEASGIAGALDGESSAMQVMGRTEADPNPVRMLAVALAHAHNAIRALTEEVATLRDEVDSLAGRKRKRGDFLPR